MLAPLKARAVCWSFGGSITVSQSGAAWLLSLERLRVTPEGTGATVKQPDCVAHQYLFSFFFLGLIVTGSMTKASKTTFAEIKRSSAVVSPWRHSERTKNFDLPDLLARVQVAAEFSSVCSALSYCF